eukprot:1890186-Amphidinium_carterae.1
MLRPLAKRACDLNWSPCQKNGQTWSASTAGAGQGKGKTNVSTFEQNAGAAGSVPALSGSALMSRTTTVVGSAPIHEDSRHSPWDKLPPWNCSNPDSEFDAYMKCSGSCNEWLLTAGNRSRPVYVERLTDQCFTT